MPAGVALDESAQDNNARGAAMVRMASAVTPSGLARRGETLVILVQCRGVTESVDRSSALAVSRGRMSLVGGAGRRCGIDRR
jgi:hypothetical protein